MLQKPLITLKYFTGKYKVPAKESEAIYSPKQILYKNTEKTGDVFANPIKYPRWSFVQNCVMVFSSYLL